MKYLKFLIALAMGVIASSSGMIQVGAAVYAYFVDFATKEVANFTAFKQTFNDDTYNLENYVTFYVEGEYKYDSCPTAFTQNVTWRLYADRKPTGASVLAAASNLPDFFCTTNFTPYFVQLNYKLLPTFLEAIVNDDAIFMEFASEIRIAKTAATLNRTLSLKNLTVYFELSYDFNTTYLFNYFLSDQKYNGRVNTAATWTFTSTQTNRLTYVFTNAGNDTYTIYNNNGTSIGTTRKKYGIDYNEEFFRGESVGAGFQTTYSATDTALFTTSSGDALLNHYYQYYYLNVANLAQAIVDAPIISFTEENCSGGFLDINVGCYVNNALAYIVNDAPVISDAFTLLNTGIELAAQTFGIIGNFSDDNVFGFLILVGFGFIAVKWFLKNDE